MPPARPLASALPARRLPRRALPALGLLLARPARALPGEIRFRVMREGSAIGTHRVAFVQSAGELTARTEVDILVKLLGITVFRFSHRFEEVWAGDRLRRAASRLDRNGTVTEMRAEAAEDAVQVQAPSGRFRLPAAAAPLTWWDSRRFGRPLFDDDSGQLLRVQWSRQALPEGGTLWHATGDTESEARYAADGTWIGWKTRAEDGSTVVYERAT
ncbi:DUF6134 family protein [Roseicella sp. DB1501]|uniref:DUF6134 family protein n=1 Tax=Roseicella sp. DB1501 TaxID=2730925 RepID=UPI0014927CC1|nr:DUF6134 family protein [Roseicella sp. DB1501]NOG73041.1 hypothetical protein [Roseicella sp. DB1501]